MDSKFEVCRTCVTELRLLRKMAKDNIVRCYKPVSQCMLPYFSIP